MQTLNFRKWNANKTSAAVTTAVTTTAPTNGIVCRARGIGMTNRMRDVHARMMCTARGCMHDDINMNSVCGGELTASVLGNFYTLIHLSV